MSSIHRASTVLRRGHFPLSNPHRPAPLLTSHHIRHGRRHFHESLYIEAVTTIDNAFHYVHDGLGLDWVTTIVLVGAVFDRVVRFPLTWYANRKGKEREALKPLLTIWSQRFQMATFEKEQALKKGSSPALGEAELKKHRAELQREFMQKRQVKTKELFQKFGLQRWKSVVPMLASLPPYILFVDSLRRLAGVGTFWGQYLGSGAVEVDPTLTTGGMLWFQDLTVADPYMALPVICASVAWYRMYRRYGKEMVRSILGSKGATPIPRISVITGRIQLMLPSLFIVASALPSGVFIFTTTVAIMGVADDIMLKKLKARMPTIENISDKRYAFTIKGAGALDVRKAAASLAATRPRGR